MSTLSTHHVSPQFEQSLDQPPNCEGGAERLQGSYDELLAAYKREIQQHLLLQKEFQELKIMVQHQRKMFGTVKELYSEQVLAAATDALTGLPNHRTVISRIEAEIVLCQTLQKTCAILFVDIDHFKQVNDTWGHLAGDAILQEVGSRLRIGIRKSDFVGRYGGEEFAIVLSDTSLQEAYELAERLRSLIATDACTWESEDTHAIMSAHMSASIGVAIYQLHGTSRIALIEAADRAMYMAKYSGRNRVCIADIVPT